MTRYIVCGPEYLYVEPVPGVPDGGPSYRVCDVFLVDAPNRRAARWAAWRRARRNGDAWPDMNAGDGRHPLAGVTVESPDDMGVETPEGWGAYYVDATPKAVTS